jgi:Ser/Thr protein kinase RdoA (MazF antagonist)
MQRLGEGIEKHRSHRNYAVTVEVAREILARNNDLAPLANLPPRAVHGDLKISNVLFSATGEAIALVDLDTLAEMTIPVELGDAWRSWCNPQGEDAVAPCIDQALLAAALRGYARETRGLLTPAEIDVLPTAIETIALELSARFCLDALEETYFGWDPTRFANLGEHNLVRAKNQLALARSLGAERAAIRALVARAF